MNTLEIAVPQELKVEGVSNSEALQLQEIFVPFFEKAEGWKQKAMSIKVDDIDQVEEMENARIARLELKKIRVEVEHKRKGLKEEIVSKGKAIDGMANVIKYLIEPIERHLKEQEDFAKIQEERRKEELFQSRVSKLQKYDVNTSLFNIREMEEEQFDGLLKDSKEAFELKAEKAKQEEQARIEEQKRQAKENEKMRLENERLKKEAQEREAELEAERKKAEAEREEQQRLASELKAKKEAEEQARLEAEAIKNRLEAEKAEQMRQQELAPDKDKLNSLAVTITKLEMPEVSSEEAKKVIAGVVELLNETSSFIKERSHKL